MKVSEILFERASDILYHYTNTYKAAAILTDGVFKLSSASGSEVENKFATRGYPYFLSTTRSKTGDYHRNIGSGGVMFVLSGDWFNARYPVKPVDYWEGMHVGNPERGRESEDRVLSKRNEIPLNGITSIHVYLKGFDERRSPQTRTVLLQGKKLGIPTYLYTDQSAWRYQDTRKAVNPSSVPELLKGAHSSGYYRISGRGDKTGYGRSGIMSWLELIMKKPGDPLSPKADKLRYELVYYGDNTQRLRNDLVNARTPESSDYQLATRLTDYMTKNKIEMNSLSDILKKKWSNKK